MPSALGGDEPLVVLAIEAPAGLYGAGMRVGLRQRGPDGYAKLLNRDVLVPRSGGRFAFHNSHRDDTHVAVLQLPAPDRDRQTRLDCGGRNAGSPAVTKLRVLSLSTLYPHDQAPNFGVFVERQMQAVMKRGDVDLVLISPQGIRPSRWAYTRGMRR